MQPYIEQSETNRRVLVSQARVPQQVEKWTKPTINPSQDLDRARSSNGVSLDKVAGSPSHFDSLDFRLGNCSANLLCFHDVRIGS